MHQLNHTRQIGKQRGITLLESLIAIVVAALGILGILGVQMRTLTDTQTSMRRAQAIRLIEDLSERMKVNPNALSGINTYVTGWTATPPTTAATKNVLAALPAPRLSWPSTTSRNGNVWWSARSRLAMQPPSWPLLTVMPAASPTVGNWACSYAGGKTSARTLQAMRCTAAKKAYKDAINTGASIKRRRQHQHQRPHLLPRQLHLPSSIHTGQCTLRT
jgi:type IV pilus assembly protein PilV